ncbi:Rv0909 family putative TA system antitoxin [Nocardioides sp.]|uniref:Rv0909 family putative TA system antitoxin n=1 Tax=Nocardioides sp. TaxID=35761 RepID=UPI0035118645
MGFADKLKKSLTKAVDQHGDKIAKGIDAAGKAADAKTKGKHSGQISKATRAAKDGLDKLDGRNDDIR